MLSCPGGWQCRGRRKIGGCEYIEYPGSLGVRGGVLGFSGLVALDWGPERRRMGTGTRREGKGVPHVEMEAACVHG